MDGDGGGGDGGGGDSAMSLEGASVATPLRADCVLCSDLIYAGDAETTRKLVQSVVALEPTVVVVCHEVRFEGSEEEEKRFFDELRAAGFGVERVPIDRLDQDARAENIIIHLVHSKP